MKVSHLVDVSENLTRIIPIVESGHQRNQKKKNWAILIFDKSWLPHRDLAGSFPCQSLFSFFFFFLVWLPLSATGGEKRERKREGKEIATAFLSPSAPPQQCWLTHNIYPCKRKKTFPPLKPCFVNNNTQTDTFRVFGKKKGRPLAERSPSLFCKYNMAVQNKRGK